MKTASITAVAALLIMVGGAQERVVIIHAKGMIDVVSGRFVKDATVVVSGNEIVAVGQVDSVPAPAGASVIRLPTMTLL